MKDLGGFPQSPSGQIAGTATGLEADGEADSGLRQQGPSPLVWLPLLRSQTLGGAQGGPTEPDPPP